MRAFPGREQIGFLQGLTLTSFGVGPYQIDLFFDGGTILNVEHILNYVDEQGTKATYDVQGAIAPLAFHSLVRDQAIVEDICIEDTKLTLMFSKGRKLIVESDIGPYEAGHINHNGEIFVF